MGTVNVIMGVILLTLRLGGFGAWQEPHVERLGALGAERLLKIVGDVVGIDEMAVHALGHISRSDAVETVSIDEGVALGGLGTVAEGGVAQLLIIGNDGGLHEEVTTHDTVHQHWDAALLAGLTDKTGEIVIEGGAWIGVTVRLRLLIVMAKLDDDIVAWFDARKYLIPSAFVDKTLGGTAVDSVVVDEDMIIEIALQSHRPATFLLTARDILVGSGRVANDEDGRGLVGHGGRQTTEHDKNQGQAL